MTLIVDPAASKRQKRKTRRNVSELSELQSVYAMCLKKRRLSTRFAAREAVRLGQRAYRCPQCRCWHLTSKGVESI